MSIRRPRLTIGYLHVGPSEHGVCRYGRLLASEAKKREDASILEYHVTLGGEARRDRRLLAEAARAFSAAQVVHVQVSVWGEGTWGRGWAGVRRLQLFRRLCGRPLVVTLHDANVFAALGIKRVSRCLARYVVERLHGRNVSELEPFMLAHWVLRFADRVFPLLKSEMQYLEHLHPRARLHRIPHFMEGRPPRIAEPRSSNAEKRIVLPGFIFKSKGHRLMVEAMPELPGIKVVFVGGPSLDGGGREQSDRLLQAARDRGVADRLSITGFLPEEEYQRHLSEADLAVCPFDRAKAASGSIPALIAAGCPILASDVPMIAEYNELVPGVIPTFTPYTARALAGAVRAMLAKPRSSWLPRFAELQERLSLPRVFDQHLECYAQVAAGRPTLDGKTPTVS
jgi:glycosyltransferase involved in cell wall biosynthesis